MRRISTAVTLAAALCLSAGLTACAPDEVPASPDAAGPAGSPTPDATSGGPGPDKPAVEVPTANPVAPRPELWSANDPSVQADTGQQCSPFSLEREYLDETLTPDEFTRYAVFGAWDPTSVPEQYRPCPGAQIMSTGGMLWAMQFMDVVSPELQQDIHDLMTPTEAPPGG